MTQCTSSSLGMKGLGWARRRAQLLPMLSSPCGASRSPSTQNYWTKVQVGRKWGGEGQARFRTQKLSFRASIFKKWKSKKGWVGKFLSNWKAEPTFRSFINVSKPLRKEVKVDSSSPLTKQVNWFWMYSYKLFASFLSQALGMNYEWN